MKLNWPTNRWHGAKTIPLTNKIKLMIKKKNISRQTKHINKQLRSIKHICQNRSKMNPKKKLKKRRKVTITGNIDRKGYFWKSNKCCANKWKVYGPGKLSKTLFSYLDSKRDDSVPSTGKMIPYNDIQENYWPSHGRVKENNCKFIAIKQKLKKKAR